MYFVNDYYFPRSVNPLETTLFFYIGILLYKIYNINSFLFHLSFSKIIFCYCLSKKLSIKNNILRISFEFNFIFFIVSLFDKYKIFIGKLFEENLSNLIKLETKISIYIYINNFGIIISLIAEKNNVLSQMFYD